MNGVVVVEPKRQAFEDGPGVWQEIDAGIIALDRPHEGLGHAIGLRAGDGRRQRLEAEVAGEGSGLLGDVA